MTKFKYGCMNEYMELRNAYTIGGMHIWMTKCNYVWRNVYAPGPRNAHMDDGISKQMYDGISKHMDDEISKQMYDGISKHIDDEISEHMDDGISKRMDDEMSKHMDDWISKHMDDWISEHMDDGLHIWMTESKYV